MRFAIRLPLKWFWGIAIIVLMVAPAVAAAAEPLAFHVTFDKTVSAAPFTGRVYVMLTAKETTELPGGINWFSPEPIFARDVKEWKPGETLVIAGDALAYPIALAQLPKKTYSIHAVMDFDRGDRRFSTAAGNGHNKPVRRELDPASTGPVPLVIDQVWKEAKFTESERVKEVDIESKLLTAFHGKPTRLQAAVILPQSFAREPKKRYPVLYVIPGFTGDHRRAQGGDKTNPTDVAGVEMLYVVLNPLCRNGHHVFADSENNGPGGRALVEELIPHIEKEFRALGTPGSRFLMGGSSGGWSSLWLQITYPDFFGGVWAWASDPVDFRDFQRINIYQKDANMFTDAEGKPRPIARDKNKPIFHIKPFSDMETVMGHGGQLGSFEAVFSPRGPDGQPKQLWDRATGKIDPAVAERWRKYDIRLVLERDWKTLEPKLKKKLHVYMGAEDNFYLDGATILLKESLAKLGSDAVVEIFPGKGHGLLDKAMRERVYREMAERFKEGQSPE